MVYSTILPYNEHNDTNKKKPILFHIMFLLSSICIIYNSGYFVYTTGENKGTYLLIITLIPLIVMCVKKILLDGKINGITWVYIIWIYIYICSIILNFSIETMKSFIVPILMLTFAFTFVHVVEFEIFIKYFIRCMKFITIVSLATFICRDLILSHVSLPIVTNSNGAVYYNGVIFGFLQFYGDMNIRNIGLFWEPGLFASFLIIAIVFELCLKNEKPKVINLIIFTLGLISTQSAAGYVLGLFVITLMIVKNQTDSFWGGYIILILAVVVYMNYNSILDYCLTVNYELFSKLTETTMTGTTRINSNLINLDIFKDYFAFGAGFYNSNIIYGQTMWSYNVAAQTSTSTYFMACVGIFGVLYSCLWVVGIWKIPNTNFITKLTILSIILIIINKEPHHTILFTYCFLFYLLRGVEFKNNNQYYKI